MIKVLSNIVVFLALASLTFSELSAQLITNDKVINKGKIVIKKKVLHQNDGHIDNEEGHIILGGPTTTLIQDTLLGRVDYIRDLGAGRTQQIPQIYYWDIRMSGESKKLLADNAKNLISMSRFVSASDVMIDMNDLSRIDVYGYITHDGYVNMGKSTGLIQMNGLDSQQVDGKGLFKELALDNNQGADVINEGGFEVNTSLELKRGRLRNDDSNNFAMSHQSWIIRHVGGSLKSEPEFKGDVSVKYLGNGAITAGPEIPNDSTLMQDLSVENTGGLTLSKNTTVNRDLHVGYSIETEPDTSNKYVLTMTSDGDPTFGNPNAEIKGSFRRTYIVPNERIIFNNPYTYALFNDIDTTNLYHLTFRVRPRTFPPFSNRSSKVERNLEITAGDRVGNLFSTIDPMEVGYGWRYTQDTAYNEMNNLNLSEVKLQKFRNSEYDNIESSRQAQWNDTTGWAYSYATGVSELGQFAIGISESGRLIVRAIAFLEGPYQYGSNGYMSNALRAKDLVPNTPPDMYPYNKDPNRDSIQLDTLPSNVVDWVLLEFIKESLDSIGGDQNIYKSCLLLTDGSIVEPNGTPVSLAQSDKNDREYYVAVRHRNHLAVVSSTSVKAETGTETKTIDFTNPGTLLGGASAAKPVGFASDNSLIFGMIAGDVNGDGAITSADEQYVTGESFQIWQNRDIEGYNIFDATMEGIVTTKDINATWNNRGRTSFAQ